MKPGLRYEIDGCVFHWDLDNNYIEIYNDTETTPEHLIATVPAGQVLDMCTYVEVNELYKPELDFDADE